MAPRNSGLGEVTALSEEQVNSFDRDEDDSQEDYKPSLRETLEANFDRLDSGDDEETDLDEGAPKETSAGRDEKGRFAAKSKNITAPESDGGETTDDATAQAIESAPSTIPVLAPPGWAADAAPLFNQIPARAQQEIVKRETDLRRGLQQATEKAAQVERTWTEVEQVLKPYESQLARAGVRPAQALGQLMSWQQYLDSDTDNALIQLAQSYGRTFGQLAQVEQQRPQESPAIRELRQQNQQLMGLFQQQQQQRQQYEQQTLASDVNAFAQETDPSTGSPLRPFLEHVIDDMLPLIPHLKATNPGLAPRELLQKAYDKAIWLNDSTRQAELQRQQPRALTKESIHKARNAQKLVTGEALGSPAPDKPKGLRAHLEANAEKLGI